MASSLSMAYRQQIENMAKITGYSMAAKTG
jgi:hypothetical protein